MHGPTERDGSGWAHSEVAQPSRGSRPLVWAWRGTLVVLLLSVVWAAYRIVLGDNFHAVVPEAYYRSAQLDAARYGRLIEKYGIRTMVNLRGPAPDRAWYHAEKAVCKQKGVQHHDVIFSAFQLPAPEELKKLVRVLQESPRPILMHCKRGADRTGLAAGIVVLLQPEGTLEAARKQLSWQFAHVPIGRLAELREFFDLYEAYLRCTDQEHSREVFIGWVEEHYRPGHQWALIEPLAVPAQLPADRPLPARFRVTNASLAPWRMRRGPNAGVHLRYYLLHEGAPESELYSDGAGFFERTVWPGEALELTLALPATRRPGRYRLRVDMVDGQRGPFALVGSPMFETTVEVVEPKEAAKERGRGH